MMWDRSVLMECDGCGHEWEREVGEGFARAVLERAVALGRIGRENGDVRNLGWDEDRG